MTLVSLFGAGFIGNAYKAAYPEEVHIVPREGVHSLGRDILYMISTVHNYHPKLGEPYLDAETNIMHFLKVLNMNKNKDIVFNLVSTWFVYGNTPDAPASEDSHCDPKGFYSITARAREQLLISWCETFGLKYRILRLGNVIGIGDKKISRMKNALQFMVRELTQGREIELYKNAAIRDFIDVRDVVKAIHLVLEKGETNQIYNIANGQGLSVYDLVQYAFQQCGYTGRIKEIPVPDFHKTVQVPRMWLDTRKIQKLGYVKSHDIKTSITEMVHYYRNEEK
jgi:nucleoside-diphosphate-sugar epimerase